jgi:hypothetical protein
MRKLALIALLAVAHGLAAFGGTSESWLGATQPWDSVPKKELNLGLQGHGGDGRPGYGALAEWGIFDQLMLAGTWEQPVDGGSGSGHALVKVREADVPRWRPALALAVEFDRRSSATAPQDDASYSPELIAAIEPWDQSLVINYAPMGIGFFRVGYWSPYVTSFIRFGLEGVTNGRLDAPWHLLPQVTFQAPGDLSAVLGAETLADGSGQWAWMARISYQLFPSP